MSKHKIAVISDTHNTLRDEVLEQLETAEVVLHAGDITSEESYEKLNASGKLIAVRGNCDRTWAEILPEDTLVELFGKKVYMVHNKKDIAPEAEEADIIIYGHSHIYNLEETEDTLYLNPGSAGTKRFGRPVSMAILEIDDSGKIEVEKIDL